MPNPSYGEVSVMLRSSHPSPRSLPSLQSARALGGSRARRRGATMVEYALLIVAIMVLAAGAYRELGKRTRMNSDKASAELDKK